MALPKPEGATGGGGDSASFAPFIKAKDIGKKEGDSATLTFLGRAHLVDGNFGEQLVADVKHGNKEYGFGITLTSVNYRLLYERFGRNEKKWKGAVKVVLKRGASKKLYLAVARQ